MDDADRANLKSVLDTLAARWGKDDVKREIRQLFKRKRGPKPFGLGIDVWTSVKAFQSYLEGSNPVASRSVARVCELLEYRQRGRSSSELTAKSMENITSQVEKRRASDSDFRLRCDQMLAEAEKAIADHGGWENAVIIPMRFRGQNVQGGPEGIAILYDRVLVSAASH